MAYCQWLSDTYDGTWRLPTEAEWEFAARGGNEAKDTRFSGGDRMDNLGWYRSNADMHPHPVGQKQPNELGLYDMSGNAREWCHDFFSEGYYASSPKENPQGPDKGAFHSLRGGSWYTDENFTTVTGRSIRLSPNHPDYSMGFRVVLEN